MVALGFPNKDSALLKSIYKEYTPQIANSFFGSYTNTIDTVNIHFKNNEFLVYYSKYNFTGQLKIRDSSTLISSGRSLEFNDDKSEFYYLMDGKNPVFKRITEND